MGIQGVVVAGIVCLLFGVFLPRLVKGRSPLADSAAEHLSSMRTRVVAVGGAAAADVRRHGRCAGRATRSSRRKAMLVSRPGDLRQVSAADARSLAVARARIAARRSRRAAGRRRRNVLNLALIALTVVVLAVGLATAMSAWWALVPAALATTSLVASRRADAAATARDRQDVAELDAAEQRLELAVARAEKQQAERRRQAAQIREARTFAALAGRGSTAVDAPAEAIAVPAVAPAEETAPEETAELTETAAPAVRAAYRERSGSSTVDAASWTPAAVPAPVYTMKAPARRAVAAPYDDVADAEANARRVPKRPTAPAVASAPLGSTAREHLAERERPQEPPADMIDLAAVLERRRAKGA